MKVVYNEDQVKFLYAAHNNISMMKIITDRDGISALIFCIRLKEDFLLAEINIVRRVINIKLPPIIISM